MLFLPRHTYIVLAIVKEDWGGPRRKERKCFFSLPNKYLARTAPSLAVVTEYVSVCRSSVTDQDWIAYLSWSIGGATPVSLLCFFFPLTSPGFGCVSMETPGWRSSKPGSGYSTVQVWSSKSRCGLLEKSWEEWSSLERSCMLAGLISVGTNDEKIRSIK